MIKRVVMMQFRSAEIAAFREIFEETKDQIRAFPGCEHLELWQDANQSNRIFTFSYWRTEDELDRYRHSSLFKTTWARTKVLFAEKPEAWSVEVISETR